MRPRVQGVSISEADVRELRKTDGGRRLLSSVRAPGWRLGELTLHYDLPVIDTPSHGALEAFLSDLRLHKAQGPDDLQDFIKAQSGGRDWYHSMPTKGVRNVTFFRGGPGLSFSLSVSALYSPDADFGRLQVTHTVKLIPETLWSLRTAHSLK